MKITNVSCTQFAGIRDRSISLFDGINVIYGKNESGKSTLVNLLSRTLFQNARLDRRSDKEFIELYFPGPTILPPSRNYPIGKAPNFRKTLRQPLPQASLCSSCPHH